MYSYSNKSSERLNTCDSRLIDIFNEVIKYYDNTILEGHRDRDTQNHAYDMGHSKVEFPNSKHNRYPSAAVDAAPWPIPENWGEAWKDRVKFYELAAIVKFVAASKGIKIRWGGDWDSDGDYWDNSFDDLVHFEIDE